MRRDNRQNDRFVAKSVFAQCGKHVRSCDSRYLLVGLFPGFYLGNSLRRTLSLLTQPSCLLQVSFGHQPRSSQLLLVNTFNGAGGSGVDVDDLAKLRPFLYNSSQTFSHLPFRMCFSLRTRRPRSLITLILVLSLCLTPVLDSAKLSPKWSWPSTSCTAATSHQSRSMIASHPSPVSYENPALVFGRR